MLVVPCNSCNRWNPHRLSLTPGASSWSGDSFRCPEPLKEEKEDDDEEEEDEDEEEENVERERESEREERDEQPGCLAGCRRSID